MGWRRAELTEVIDARDNAAAEEMLPDAVHDDSVEQGILFRDKPFGQFTAPTLLFLDRHTFLHLQDLQESPVHSRTKLPDFTTDAEVNILRIRGITRSHRHLLVFEVSDQLV